MSAVNFVLQNLLKRFSSRKMRSDFMEKYSSEVKPHILRDMYRFMTDDATAPETSSQAAIDERVMDFFASSDDPDLVMDMRANNGRLANQDFDVFWNELQKLIEELSVVNERRTDSINYLSDFLSVRDLKEQVLKRCPPGTSAPSEAWIRLQFQPTNPTLRTSLKYTSRFNIKYKVQQRLLRNTHPDAKYCAVQYRYLKDFCVRFRSHLHFISVDDKAIVPVGSGQAVSTNVRRIGRSLVAGDTPLYALDHDYHVAGLVPSVALNILIPDDKNDSFYKGKLTVSVKDKFFSPSSPIRHSAETAAMLRRETIFMQGNHPDDPDVGIPGDFGAPMLAVYSDGGPDHNTSFMSVKLAALVLFVSLNLDVYIAVRCAPMQSYRNPAERCMSTLNIALQSVSLARSPMTPQFEGIMKGLTTLSAVRARAERQPAFKAVLTESMQMPLETVIGRFQRLVYSGNHVAAFVGASDEAIEDMPSCMGIFAEPVELDKWKKNPERYPKLADFLDRHLRSRTYSLQIMKCTSAECWYCGLLAPIRMEPEVYDQIKWLPDPQQKDGEEWKSFDEVYGTDTDDSKRPSLSQKPTSAKDMAYKASGLFTTAKVRGFVICSECGKRRCVFAKGQLTPAHLVALKRVQEDLLYSCGSCLFPEDDEYASVLVLKEALNCSSPIETIYYSALSSSLQPICCICGDLEVLIANDHPGLRELCQKFRIVRPICNSCWERGDRPATRNPVLQARR